VFGGFNFTSFFIWREKEIIHMIDVSSKDFRIKWAAWMLFLGVSLFFVHTIWYVHSFSDYIRAFIEFDMPSSWCPTFMTVYGVSTLAFYFLDKHKRIWNALSWFTGFGLLPIGIYTLSSFTAMESFNLSLMYIYPQAIHVSQILTGLLTFYFFAKSMEN